ncbi:MAG: prefoldin subunit alpha [Candidatus Methanomethylicia archaeon]|nr:prefoldin subunit alpha [Candidatus Methanomethylicia archaeon]MCX8169295.1 prefoldin subunit alpha [Candidatus Methanomethylicia archaeon]MDW7988922.1 prefoldin subunit alpha [Nitrososphaerota archaeon]
MSSQDQKKIEEEIGRIYAQITTLNSIAEALKEQSENLQRQILDLQLSLDTLNEIGRLGKSHKILLPLGSSLMIDAIIVDDENSYINIGSNVVIKRSNRDVRGILEKRMEMLQKQHIEVQRRLNETITSIQYLQNQLSVLIQQSRRKG